MIRENVVKTFTELVAIDAPSYKERGVASYIRKRLEMYGIDFTEDEGGRTCGSDTGNLFANVAGNFNGSTAKPSILLSSHMDTVSPALGKKAVVHEDGKITSDGTTVLGADDFAGITAIIEAIAYIKENNIPHRAFELLFTVSEETYCEGAKHFDYSKLKSRQAYVLDLSENVGEAAYAAPTILSFRASVTGKASHAGFAPEEGINALQTAAKAISQLKQGRIDSETTANIGLISGGEGINIVPSKCSVEGEIRSMSHEKALSTAKAYKNIFEKNCSETGASLLWREKIHIKAYETHKDSPAVKDFTDACIRIGITPKFKKTFGGSDNNVFAEHGIEGIVLATAMNKVHSTEEYTTIDELTRITELVVELLRE